jgi:hypothetical protein
VEGAWHAVEGCGAKKLSGRGRRRATRSGDKAKLPSGRSDLAEDRDLKRTRTGGTGGTRSRWFWRDEAQRPVCLMGTGRLVS